MGVRRIVPDLRSDRFDESRSFYVDVLGLRVAMDLGWVMTLVSPAEPLAQLTLLRKDAAAPIDPQVSIQVDDIDAVHAAALRHGAKIVYPLTEEPWGVRRFFVEDPNGVVVNVMTHIATKD